MTKRQREKSRNTMRRIRQRMGGVGWINRGQWMRKEWVEKVAFESARLGVSKRAYWSAIFEVGLKFVRPTDVVLAAQRWREWVGMPRHKLVQSGQIKCDRDPVSGRILRQHG